VTSVAGRGGSVILGESDITNLTTDLAATEKTANKGATSGYAPLNSSSLVPTGNLATGSASSTTYLRGDSTWATPAGGVNLDSTNSDIQPLGSQNAGASSLAAKADHIHPTTGLLLSTNNLSELTSSSATARSNLGAAQGLIPTALKNNSSSPYTANPGDFIPVDVSGGNVIVTLPLTPADKTRVAVKLINLGATSNTVTINTGGTPDVFNKTGGGTSLSLSLTNQGMMLQYATSGAIWYVQSDDLSLSQLDTRYQTLSALPDGTNTGDLPVWSTSTSKFSLGPMVSYIGTFASKPTASGTGRFVFFTDVLGGTFAYDDPMGSGYRYTPQGQVMQILGGASLGSSNSPLPSSGTGQATNNLNFIQGSGINLTTGYDANGMKVDVEISASGGGGGSGGIIGKTQAIISSSQTIPAESGGVPSATQALGLPSVTFTAPTTGNVLVTMSAFVTGPGTGAMEAQLWQTAGDKASVLSGTTGAVQFVGSGLTGTNAASGGSTPLVKFINTASQVGVMRSVLITGLTNTGTQSYTWQFQLFCSGSVTGSLGADVATIVVEEST